MPPTLTPYSPFLTAKHPGGSEILDRNLLAIKKAIGDADAVINRITRIVNIDAGGAGVNDAQFWLSTANPLLPNGVDMGALGTGVLQQTVTLGVATPVAVSLVPTDVVFGSAAGLIEQDHRFVYDTATGSLWLRQFASGVQTVTIATAFSSNETSLLIRSDTTAGALTLETGTAATSQGPAFQLRGNFYPSFHDWVSVQRAIGVSFSYDGSGGVDQNNGVFKVNLKSFYEFSGNSSALAGAAYLDSFSWRGVTHRIIGSNSTNADGVNFHAFYPGTLLSAPNWSAESSATVAIYGPTVFTPVDGSVGTIGAVYALRITGAGHIDRTDGTWEWRTGSTSPVSPSGAGRIRYNESLNRMEFSENGSAYSPFGTGGGTVTSVTASTPLSYTGTTSVNITHDNSALGSGAHGSTGIASFTTDAQGHVTAFTGANYQAAGNYITALTGDGTATGPGSVPFTLATVNASPGTYAYATVVVNGKGLATTVTAGATPALAARTLSATAPLLIDGAHGPLDLSADRTFSHDTSGVGAGTTDWATVQVDVYGHVTGIAAGTWPTASHIVVSTGTGPTGEAAFTYNTTSNLFRLDGFQGINVDPGGLGDGAYALAVLGNATQDRIYMRPGGGPILAASGAYKMVEISPATTAIDDDPANSLLATVFMNSMAYTFDGASTVGEVVTLYLAGPPTFPFPLEGGQYTLHVASGISWFEGPVLGTSSISSTVSIGTSGELRVGGGANTLFADGGAIQVGFFGATPVGQQTGGSATAGGTYTATEQVMLQKAYDCLRSIGLLS